MEYRDMGVPPAGLLNYLVRFGWSYGDEEVFSMPDLVQKFDWERCGRGDGKFDMKKLKAIVFEHLKRADLMSDEAWCAGVRPFLDARGLTVDDALLRAAAPLYRERGETWAHAAELMDYVLRDPPAMDDKARAKFLVPERAALLRDVAALFEGVADFSAGALDAAFAAFIAGRGVEMKDVAQPVRVALTGRTASPGLFDVAALLGKERSVARLRRAAAIAEGSASG
jgi:glutamyl-tRNA synthetase